MSKIKITSDGFLLLDTEMNHIYEVSVTQLINDNTFINHLIEKSWFDESMFFDLISKLQKHKIYKYYDFTKIIFEASEKFFIIKMCTDDELFSRVQWFRDLEKLSNTF